MEILDNFRKACEKNGITLYEGFIDYKVMDAYLLGGERTVIDYCSRNAIKSIILSLAYEESLEIDDEIVRERINNQFERLVNQYPYCTMIERTGTEPYQEILSETIEQFNLEIDRIFEDQGETVDDNNDLEKEEDISLIDAWIFHDGCKICINIFDSSDVIKEDAEQNGLPTERQLIEKYLKILEEGLKARQIELVAEYNRKLKEEMNGVLSKIRDFAKNYQKLVDMKTQKSRNDLAERLYAKCTMDDQCQWLTKKEVCEIVNEEYMRKIGMEDIEFS